MPIIKSAVKKMKQDRKRYAKNLRVKRALKEAEKAFVEKPTFETLKALQSKIDTAAKKNIIPKNRAARQMAKWSAIAKDKGVKIVATKKPATTTKPAAKKPVAKKAPAKTAAKPAAKKTPAKK